MPGRRMRRSWSVFPERHNDERSSPVAAGSERSAGCSGAEEKTAHVRCHLEARACPSVLRSTEIDVDSGIVVGILRSPLSRPPTTRRNRNAHCWFEWIRCAVGRNHRRICASVSTDRAILDLFHHRKSSRIERRLDLWSRVLRDQGIAVARERISTRKRNVIFMGDCPRFGRRSLAALFGWVESGSLSCAMDRVRRAGRGLRGELA